MKRLAMVFALLALFATSASAISSGQGGYVYWSKYDSGASAYSLYRMEILADWTVSATPAIFDCVTHLGSGPGDFNIAKRNNLEVLDPRDQGGTGSLLLVANTNNTPADDGWGQPRDIVKEVPSTQAKSILCDGKVYYPGWTTVDMGKVVAAPANWMSPSNSISLAGVTTVAYNVHVLYDTDGSGAIEAVSSEGTKLDLFANPIDVEMGGDGHLYVFAGNYNSDKRIERVSSAGVSSTLFTIVKDSGDPSNPVKEAAEYGRAGACIAVGAGSDPIVYLMANDAAANTAIFALRDGSGDGVVDYANVLDTVEKVWASGDFGLTVNSGYGQDVEFYRNPDTGKQFLLFNSYYTSQGMMVVELADNGLMAVAGAMIATGAGLPEGYGSGFELDMNPAAAVPEPATLLLLGTGALGALGWMRRRRAQ